jgi:hypothetical protein
MGGCVEACRETGCAQDGLQQGRHRTLSVCARYMDDKIVVVGVAVGIAFFLILPFLPGLCNTHTKEISLLKCMLFSWHSPPFCFFLLTDAYLSYFLHHCVSLPIFCFNSLPQFSPFTYDSPTPHR